MAGRGQPAADNSSSVGQEAQSRRLPLKMQLTRGRSRVAIATLDPDSALKRTVGASAGISYCRVQPFFGYFAWMWKLNKRRYEDTGEDTGEDTDLLIFSGLFT